MKKKYFFTLLKILFLSPVLWAQVTTTDAFESDVVGSTSFTSNSQVFNVTAQANGPFSVYALSGTGWNGTAADNQYIDNSGHASTTSPVGFTIATAGAVPFKFNSVWLYLAQSNANVNTTGSLTIVGKLGGVTKFTATASSGFNTNAGLDNGFTLIDMTSFGGSNNSNTPIDQIVFTTGNNFQYVAVDAFKWTTIPVLSAVTSFTNTSCNGGANGRASVSVSGGTSPYSYSWAPSGGTASLATGLSAGVYSCTIIDASSSSITATVNVGQPSAISTSTAVTNVVCNGGSSGSATVTTTGGAGGYTYLWSTGASTSIISGLMAGAYTYTVTDANSCSVIKSAIVIQPSAVVTTTAVTNVACNGGSSGVASVTASGGTGSYTYLWSTGGTTSAITGLTAGAYSVTVKDANNCTSTKNATITQSSAISTSTAVTNVTCNGGSTGSATVTTTGGAGGYTYLWSTGASTSSISGLLAGAYTYTVTDANSCTVIKSAIVTQPSAVVTTTAVTNVACNGGSNGVASVTASGGAGSYTYLWSNGGTTAAITGLTAGAYSVTVKDANNCTSTKNATIIQPAAISTSTAVTNVACNGGSNGVASVTASGGAGSYTYLWSNGGTTSAITGLMGGVYTATVTDANSCTSIKSATVTQPSAISTSTAVTNVACNGSSNGVASVTASGGTGSYTYLWSNGGTTAAITGLTAGAYSVTVKDANNCTSTKNATITQPAAISTSTTVTNVACNGGSNGVASVTASGGTSPYTYSWAPSGGTSATATGLTAGNYTCTITDANACSTTKIVVVSQPTSGISATTSSTSVSCFGGSNGSAGVTASGGTSPYTYSWAPSGGTSATATGLTAGNYTCTITDANACSITEVISVNEPAVGLSATKSVTPVSCFGQATGSGSVNVSGGTPSYSYAWSPSGGTASSASGLAAGTYTCIITDANGCMIGKLFNITQPSAALSATTTATSILCNGGSATVTVTGGGGTSPYTGTGSFAETAGSYTYTVTDNNGCMASTNITLIDPSVLTASASATSIACNGGSAAVTVTGSGGTSPYTATGLFTETAGSYTYTVTDNNGCMASTNITLIDPSVLTASASATSIACNGGSATVTVTGSGGTSPYTGTGAFTEIAGSYTYTVTDNNGCMASTNITLIDPSVLTASASATSISCNGGSATVTVTGGGGTAPYTGTGSFTDVAGSYTYTVTDNNGCMASANVTLIAPSILTASASATSITCNGGSATVTVTGGGGTAPYTGIGSFTDVAGSYTYTVTDNNGCMTSTNINIIQPSAITANQSFTVCAGGNVTVGPHTYSTTGTYTDVLTSAAGCDSTVTTNLTVNAAVDISTTVTGDTASSNQAGATYQWIDCANGNTAISGATGQSYSGTGTFEVMVTLNGCVGTSTCVTITSTGIRITSAETNSINVYPNPNSGTFTLSSTTESVYQIINELGQTIKTLTLNSGNNYEANIQGLPSGVYFIIGSSAGTPVKKKIIVTQ